MQQAIHKPLHRSFVDRATVRVLLTIFMYVGIIIFLYPYATSHMSSGIYFLICGAVVTLTCGALRCYLTDGDCHERTHTRVGP